MASSGLRRTALYPEHVKLNAKMVPFGGWEMPVYYSGIVNEHKAVRNAVGIFDISHMGEIDRKSTRLNSSHQIISYSVFCLKKKKHKTSPNSIKRLYLQH